MVAENQDLALQPFSETGTRLGIDKNISVGYKGEIICEYGCIIRIYSFTARSSAVGMYT